jgi:hypothetical protein
LTTFFSDRDLRGRPAEYLTIAYFQARGIEASINDASDEDRAGRASHDIVVAGELWDVKTDFVAATSKRIFVERASLEHTQSYRSCYWIPTPYGMDMRIFTVDQLAEMYNEGIEIPTFDRGLAGLLKYKHEIAGDQATNEGMFVPMDVVKAVGLEPWQVAKELMQHA